MAVKPSTLIMLTGVAIVGVISFTWFRTAARAGEFTTLVPVFEGSCKDVGGLPGSEDIVLDRAARRMIISSDDRRAAGKGAPKRGAIYVMPIDGVETISARVDATKGMPARFHPHGLTRFVAADGKATIMVVNHLNGFTNYNETVVEIYDEAADNTLTHRRTVAIAGLVRINDIAATGPDSFYATSESDLAAGSLAETWSIIADNDRTGAIWYFDGTSGRKLDSGLGFANSVALSPDGRTLYATGMTSRAVFIYDREPATGAIKRRDAAQIGTFVDNLDVEEDGRVWIAAHPKLLSFVQHANDSAKGAPSQVIILEPAKNGAGGKVDQVYLQDDESGFSGASVATRLGNTMVLGSVFEPGIRVCTLPAIWKQSESHPAQRLLDTERDVTAQEAEKAIKAKSETAK